MGQPDVSKPKQAILFRAHRYSDGAAASLRRLVREAGDQFDIWLVGCCLEAGALDGYGFGRTVAYGPAALAELPYRQKLAGVRWDDTSGDNDLPVMQFFRDHPAYARYWIIEYDVRWTSDWGALLGHLSQSECDLLCTTAQTFADNPGWFHWAGLHTGGEALERNRWVKAFIPFAAVTRDALAAIDARYCRGWSGHYEAAWPTIVSLAGLSIEDIGGTGRFVPPGQERRYYWNSPADPHLWPGSFVFRPTLSDGEDYRAWTGLNADAQAWAAFHLSQAGRLVHPVKD